MLVMQALLYRVAYRLSYKNYGFITTYRQYLRVDMSVVISEFY